MSRGAGLALSCTALVLSLLRGGPPLHPQVTASAALFLLCLAAGLVLFFGPRPVGIGAALSRLVFESPRPAFNASLFLGASVIGTAVSLVLFQGLPYLDDGISSLFQARIFARGALTLPLPPHAGFYELFCVIGEKAGLGRWAGMYPPGWPALLLPGVLAGAPWLVTPLLGGALTVATAELGREVYDGKTGRIAGLAALASPLLVILSGTHLSHTATALFCALCLRSVLRLVRTGKVSDGIAAGAAWGAAFLCRPLDALLLGLLFALVPLFRWRRALGHWRAVASALAVAVLAAALLAAFQHAVTGDPLTPGHEVGMGKHGHFGFITLKGGKEHTPAKAVDFTLRRLRVMSDHLAGWPVPFFLMALLPFLALRPETPYSLLLIACPLVLAGTFAFFWYFEMYFPGRYLASAAPMLLVLGARGALLAGRWAVGRGEKTGRLAGALLTASLLFAFLADLPAEAREVRRRGGDVERTLPRVVERYGITNAVIFMDAVSVGIQEEEKLNDFFGAGFLRNTLDLDGDIVYARNLRDMNHQLVSAYPGRDYYLYRYDRDTRKAYLYRLIPEGRDYCLVSVPPLEPDLLRFDSSRSPAEGPCVTETDRSRR